MKTKKGKNKREKKNKEKLVYMYIRYLFEIVYRG